MTAVSPAPSRLTRLELQGFKSFANRTTFVFDPGITAVIGPNGSGKSNISDGVRWVLGETSHSLLRSRKTEDVIFAGGRGKSPSGMAEVTVTFDNSTGWLPIEFSEVSVTRRAFRSGENQFLINGRKARLKDIQQLTASLGQSYTVVGQGLVDAALSQRPEERRGLFEHAADLTGLQLKVTEAERNLAEAETNAERINDLLTDVAPRLRTLERAAKQAREWQGVHDRLRYLEQGYYRQALQSMLDTLRSAEHVAGQKGADADRAREEVEKLTADLRAMRIETDDVRSIVERHQARLETVTDQLRRIGHERDLTNERLAALHRRQADMTDSQQGLDDQLTAARLELDRVEQELAAATAERTAASQNAAELRRQVQGGRDAQVARQRQISALTTGAQTIERQLSEAHRKWSLVEQRRQSGAIEQDQASAAATERDQKIAQVETQLASLEGDDSGGAREETTIRSAIEELTGDAERTRSLANDAAEKVRTLSRSRDEAAARLQAFQRIQESGAGLYAGVKAVLDGARHNQLGGVRGTLAELIDVPKQFDTALEVLLGAHLQDVVVERWNDAERAIERLKANRAGRATFQPIDSVRPPRPVGLDQKLTALNGVRGVACTLISAPPELENIVISLIGRALVVDDLQTARSVLPDLPGGWTAVTLAGEIVRSGGSLTGGSAVRESGVLGRERELRELPGDIARLDAEIDAARAEEQSLLAFPSQILEERRTQESALASLIATRKERLAQATQVRSWLDGLLRDRKQAEDRTTQSVLAAEEAAREFDVLVQEIARLKQQLDEATNSRESMSDRASEDGEHLRQLEERLAAEERMLAGLEEHVRFADRQKTSLAAQLSGLLQEVAMRSDRSSAISGEFEAIGKQAERLTMEAGRLDAEKVGIEAELTPVRATARSADARLADTERSLDASRQSMLDGERARGAADLGFERIRGEIAALRQKIVDDLDMEEPEDLLTLNVALEDDFEETGREISRLRERLKRVGYIGEEAVEEFERESSRHDFLRTQLDDVEGASSDLRTLLLELREMMQRRFDETFEKVAEAFAASFTTLFGGGTARLVVVPGETGKLGGVDIVAQPPGKRLQSLALLSGGERSLTAAALLFAILKVNPAPFVLLDEVDAALDEANIVRFRERLQELAQETQAVIITHNRGTIEVADSLYGVSMRDDGVSTVLSLRMQEVAVAG